MSLIRGGAGAGYPGYDSTKPESAPNPTGSSCVDDLGPSPGRSLGSCSPSSVRVARRERPPSEAAVGWEVGFPPHRHAPTRERIGIVVLSARRAKGRVGWASDPDNGRMRLILARLVGGALRLLFAAILVVRRPRPIHAKGLVLQGEITWLRGAAESGIRWIDEPPLEPQHVVARVSRSVGLPAWLPDVIGLALRIDAGGRPADLELASTGFGVPSRFVLAVHRSPSRARLGTLLPYRSERGPVVLCARTCSPVGLPGRQAALEAALTREPWRLRLYHASPTGKWHPFAELALRPAADEADEQLRFDAVRHVLPGAGTYAWTRAMREPSYRLAQGRHPRSSYPIDSHSAS